MAKLWQHMLVHDLAQDAATNTGLWAVQHSAFGTNPVFFVARGRLVVQRKPVFAALCNTPAPLVEYQLKETVIVEAPYLRHGLAAAETRRSVTSEHSS
jgi:hypothetical protein